MFRVRNKKQTKYCYSNEEKNDAIGALGPKPEKLPDSRVREISPDEFKYFIGQDIRLEPVMISKDYRSEDLLTFYMGKNTPKRQEFIIENLRVEKNLEEEFLN